MDHQIGMGIVRGLLLVDEHQVISSEIAHESRCGIHYKLGAADDKCVGF